MALWLVTSIHGTRRHKVVLNVHAVTDVEVEVEVDTVWRKGGGVLVARSERLACHQLHLTTQYLYHFKQHDER